MVVISISTDTSLISSTSAGALRARGYAAHVDAYHVVIIGKGRRVHATQVPWINGSMYLSGGASRMIASIRAVAYTVKLAKKLRRTASRVLITSQDPFLTGVCAFMASVLSGVAFHVQVREDIYNPYLGRVRSFNWLRRGIASNVLVSADRVMCSSVRIAAACTHHTIDHRRIDVVYLLPHSPHIQALPPVKVYAHDQHKPIHIVMIGQYEKYENIATGIRAFAQVYKTYPYTHLHIVGSGPQEAFLHKLVRSLRLRPCVSFHTYDVLQSVAPYLYHADLFFSTAYAAGIDTIPLEAAAHRIPVVSPRIGFIGYELSEANVFVIPEPSAQSCADTLDKALSARLSWQEKSENAHEQAVRLYEVSHSQQEAVLKSWRKTIEAHIHPSSD